MKFIYSLLICVGLFSVGQASTSSTVDSLIALLEEPANQTDLEKRYELHQRLGGLYFDDELYETAVSRFKEGLKIAKQLQDSEKIAKSLLDIGFAKDRRTEYPEALANYKELLNLEEIQENHPTKVKALSRVSAIYQALGNYEQAFEFQMQALKHNEINEDKEGVARCKYRLGTIFFYQNQFERALEEYKAAKVLSDGIGNQRDIYSCLAALGSVYAELGDFEKNLFYNDQSLQLAKKLDYKMGIAYTLGNMGSTYLRQGNCEKAKWHIEEAIRLKSELNDNWGLIGSKLGLAELYKRCDQQDQLIPLMNEVILLSQKLNSKPRELTAYKILIDYYEQNQNIKQAYFYQKKYLALKDTILNEKTVEEMGQSQRKYEIQKKEHQISLLKKENELLVSNEKIQELRGYIFASAGLFFILLFGWIFYRLKTQKRINKLLGEKNQLLFSKNQEIAIKNKQLEYSNHDLQQFAYVASHDLKEPLRMISSYTNLLNRKYKSKFDEDGKEFMHYIVDAAGRMQILLDDLLDYSRCGTQKIPDKMVDVSDVMVIVESNLQYRVNNKNAKLIVHHERLPAIMAHRSQLIQLLQNLVGNALKFNKHANPEVVVDCQKNENRYEFSIKDNGIGISKDHHQKIFDMFKRLHTRVEYEGTGIGLATCKRIVSNMGGDIWVTSEENKGSTFFFSIPCPVEEAVMA